MSISNKMRQIDLTLYYCGGDQVAAAPGGSVGTEQYTKMCN